jgi:hypothetical protein
MYNNENKDPFIASMGEESYHNKMLELLGKLSGRVLTDMEGG